jgi:hypothetical protein
MQQRRVARRRVIVPLVLAITTTAIVGATASSAGCGDDAPAPSDARAGDAPSDTPIV